MMRTATIAGTAAAAMVLSLALAAPAQADELEDYLRLAGEAEFSGTEIVITEWNGESAAGLYEVSQGGGVMRIEGGEGAALMMGEGRVRSDSGSSDLHVKEWSQWRLADRYTTGAPEATTRLGRSARALSVFEGGQIRFLAVFDLETGAPLLTEVYDGTGNPFRVAVMMEFDPAGRPLVRSQGAGVEYEEMARVETVDLPTVAAGYWRADVYAGPAETKHAFYTDGLFSFSVFQVPGRSDPGSFSDGKEYRTDGNTYLSLLTPGAIELFWNTPDSSYVLIGDLPPDHLELVLGDLPEPGQPNVLVRAWRGLFG